MPRLRVGCKFVNNHTTVVDSESSRGSRTSPQGTDLLRLRKLLASLCNAVGVECPSGHLRVADARLTTVEKIDAIRRKWGAKRASGSEIGPGRDSGGDGPIRSTLKKPRGSVGRRPGASFRVAKKRQQGSWPLERITGIAMPRCLSRPLVSIPRQSRGLYLSEPLEAALRGR
jgi:hypothetical protein